MSKSVYTSPDIERSLSVALVLTGRLTSTSPLTVEIELGPGRSGANRTRISPLMVLATTGPVTFISFMSPDFMFTSRSPARSRTTKSPLFQLVWLNCTAELRGT